MEFTENEISKIVFESGLQIHKILGPGLLESAYEECLYFDLVNAGLKVEKQKSLPLIYKEIKLDAGYRVDFLIENKVIIEIKSIDALHPIHTAQVLTYLKLSSCKLALLINFNVSLFKDGVKRLVLGAL
jgi:GxxExxY protein